MAQQLVSCHNEEAEKWECVTENCGWLSVWDSSNVSSGVKFILNNIHVKDSGCEDTALDSDDDVAINLEEAHADTNPKDGVLDPEAVEPFQDGMEGKYHIAPLGSSFSEPTCTPSSLNHQHGTSLMEHQLNIISENHEALPVPNHAEHDLNSLASKDLRQRIAEKHQKLDNVSTFFWVNAEEPFQANQKKVKLPGAQNASLYPICFKTENGKCITKNGHFSISDQEQFVEGNWFNNALVELYSCQLKKGGHTFYMRKQKNGYLLTTDEHDFLARVAVNSLSDTNWTSIDDINRGIFSKIDLVKVIEDEMVYDCCQSRDKLVNILKTITTDHNPIRSSPSAVLLLFLSSLKDQNTFTIFESLNKNISLPDDVRTAAGECLKNETKLRERIEAPFFSRQSSHHNLKEILLRIYEEGVLGHRESLMHQCPPTLPNLLHNIEAMSPDLLLHVSKADVDVFNHLITITENPDILPFFDYLINRFLAQVEKTKGKFTIQNKIPLVNPMLGFLFKSLWEIMGEITGIVDNCSYKKLLTSGPKEWRLADLIPWPKPVDFDGMNRTTQHLYRSTDCQYRFVFKLMKHFYPNGSANNRFDYQIQLKTENQRWWTKMVNKFVKKKLDVDHDRSIWLYIIDHTLARVVVDDILSSDDFLDLYGPLVKSHWTFVTESPSENHESFRVVTHSTLKYIVQTSPFLLQTDDKSAIAQTILRGQIRCMARVSAEMAGNDLAHICFKDLIHEYIEFWALHSKIVQQYEGVPEYIADQHTNLFRYILELICKVLDKPVPVNNLSEFLRCMNEFLSDYQNLAFASNWFVKCKNGNSRGLTKVDNKIADEIDCSYLVTNVQVYLESIKDHPPQYNIRIVRQLIDYVNLVLDKNWITQENPVVLQFDAACLLMNAIRSSLMYLKEQPDYRDFSKYEKESTEPFICAINNSENFDDFRRRIDIVSESFWYVRKMDEIGLERALELMEPIFDDPIQKDVLRTSFNQYNGKFLEHIQNSAGKRTIDEKISSIIDDLETHRKDNPVKDWGQTFKTHVIPDILAGLSAVWSLMMSEDVASGSKLIQPHCIQILCVLRLLSVDRSCTSVKNHLAEILTGQGKSVVLALVSLVFALSGHDVYIACYSKYLVSRDSDNFKEFFIQLGLKKKVRFIHLRTLASEYFHPVINEERVSLRSSLAAHVRSRDLLPCLATASFNFKNTVLLIDEVDVFFSENVYGSVAGKVVSVKVVGLPEIQKHMWKLATSGVHTVDTLLEQTEEYIRGKVQSGDVPLTRFNQMRDIGGSIELLVYENGKLVTRKYASNRELFKDHLHQMAVQAIMVSTSQTVCGRINEDGFFEIKDPMDDTFSTSYIGYDCIFSYFKLKRENFEDKSGANYGYLNVTMGNISYAELPKEFLLVLGVSGTLRNVYDQEKKAMRETYNIVNYTGVPSFYGSSNLKFHQISDFTFLESVNEWLRILFTHAYSQITLGRSVMMFFRDESEIYSFVNNYSTKFATLNILTEDTTSSAKELYISRAGIPSTLTLATRGMGRGVDFKSSLAVEENGGIHVIQTFFSIDIKEETQIKGRTARKDNKGSYELIVCKTHLAQDRLLFGLDTDTINYSQLDESRTMLMEQKGKNNAESAREHLIDHETTLKYWR